LHRRGENTFSEKIAQCPALPKRRQTLVAQGTDATVRLAIFFTSYTNASEGQKRPFESQFEEE
jgi:hypothetical protein